MLFNTEIICGSAPSTATWNILLLRPSSAGYILFVWPTDRLSSDVLLAGLYACALAGLSRAPQSETLQVSCGKGWHSSSGESECFSPIASPVSESWISESQTEVGHAEGSHGAAWVCVCVCVGGGSRRTDVCLWYFMHYWSVSCSWSSGHPADN